MEGVSKIKTLEDWRIVYLQRFKDLHDNFSDEIPNEIVHGNNSENYKYKIRGNWFVTVRTCLQNAKLLNFFPKEFNDEWEDFFLTWSQKKPERKNDELGTVDTINTKEEIERANDFLIRAQEIISNNI